MFTVRHEVAVAAPVGRCFDLARSVELHADSSTEIAARAVGGRRGGLSGDGDTTVWSARFFGLRFRMQTRVEDFARPDHFADVMTRGLLGWFAHRYRFELMPDGRCAMSDALDVAAPLGPLGRVVERVYLERRMRCLVRVRLERVKAVAEGDDWRRYVER